MSNDLVSRRWLLEEYDKRHDGTPGGARKLIEEAPPVANARVVIPGAWIMRNNACVCSNCGNPVAFKLMPDGWHVGNFCTKCGADMRDDSDAIAKD